MSLPPASFPFDTRPLTDPVDRTTTRAYVRELRMSGRMPRTSPVALIVVIVVGVFFLAVFGTVFIGIFANIMSDTGSGSPLFAIFPIVVLVGIALFQFFALDRRVHYR